MPGREGLTGARRGRRREGRATAPRNDMCSESGALGPPSGWFLDVNETCKPTGRREMGGSEGPASAVG